MDLKILLPFKIFADVQNITRLVIETSAGQYGILPNRLDCVAAVIPGILTYELKNGECVYVAVDRGIFLKTGNTISVSVRNAIGGADLGALHKSVEKEFKELDESEKNLRSVMTRMESTFMIRLQNFEK